MVSYVTLSFLPPCRTGVQNLLLKESGQEQTCQSVVKHPSSSVLGWDLKTLGGLDHQVKEDIAEKFIGLKQFKGSLETCTVVRRPDQLFL